jgi:thioesterase domain-containing protein/acyl carrier protein
VRIELGEMEIALSQHPALQHAVVIGAEDQTHGMRLVAYYVTKADQCLTELDLRDFLRAKLPEPMIPAAFVGLKQIPLTPSGKLDRRALPTSSSHRPQTVEPARNALEQKLVSTWENLFHVSPIGIRDSFFDLGGHSLLATQLAVQIEENCGIHVPTGALFQFPTIAALAEHLAQDAVSSSARRIVALNERGTRPAFFCIPPLLNLGQHLGPDQPFYGLELWTPSEQAVESQDVIKQIAGRCIESIRAVQPCGPYYLGGHSFGGPVVFEIAHQLHLQNEEIGLVVLIDPDPPYATPAIAFRRQIEAFVQRLILDPSETIRHYWRAIKRRTTRGVLAKHDFAALTPKDKMMHLDGTYRAETLPCPLTLILAGDPLMLNSRPYRPISEPRLDWAEFAGCAVDIQEVPGDHYSIVDEPHVRVLTERLREILSRTMIEQLKPDTSYLCELSPEVIAASCN